MELNGARLLNVSVFEQNLKLAGPSDNSDSPEFLEHRLLELLSEEERLRLDHSLLESYITKMLMPHSKFPDSDEFAEIACLYQDRGRELNTEMIALQERLAEVREKLAEVNKSERKLSCIQLVAECDSDNATVGVFLDYGNFIFLSVIRSCDGCEVAAAV